MLKRIMALALDYLVFLVVGIGLGAVWIHVAPHHLHSPETTACIQECWPRVSKLNDDSCCCASAKADRWTCTETEEGP